MANKFIIEMTLPNTPGKLQYNVLQNNFFDNPKITPDEILRYLKGVFSTKDRLLTNFLNLKFFNRDGSLNQYVADLYNTWVDNFDETIPYSYKEAFEITDTNYKLIVFNSINIVEMITNLGATRIKSDGKELTRKTWDSNGNRTEDITYTNVYETFQVKGQKLDLNGHIYAVKCWCTTTNNEHWLWIEEKYKDEPLEAIASTFRFHENIIPFIKEIKRQGDIILVEMLENITPVGSIRPLTANEYFTLLSSES